MNTILDEMLELKGHKTLSGCGCKNSFPLKKTKRPNNCNCKACKSRYPKRTIMDEILGEFENNTEHDSKTFILDDFCPSDDACSSGQYTSSIPIKHLSTINDIVNYLTRNRIKVKRIIITGFATGTMRKESLLNIAYSRQENVYSKTHRKLSSLGAAGENLIKKIKRSRPIANEIAPNTYPLLKDQKVEITIGSCKNFILDVARSKLKIAKNRLEEYLLSDYWGKRKVWNKGKSRIDKRWFGKYKNKTYLEVFKSIEIMYALLHQIIRGSKFEIIRKRNVAGWVEMTGDMSEAKLILKRSYLIKSNNYSCHEWEKKKLFWLLYEAAIFSYIRREFWFLETRKKNKALQLAKRRISAARRNPANYVYYLMELTDEHIHLY